MKELFLKEGKSIFTFKPGDIITRIERAKIMRERYNDNLMVTQLVTEREDGSYWGDPLEFIGIYNNQIFVKHLAGYSKNKISRMNADDWSEGWEFFKLPDGVKMEDL